MLPAGTSRRESDTARDKFRSSDFAAAVSSFVQVKLISVGFIVVMLKKSGEERSYGGSHDSFVCN